nr:hypothetical protein [Prevotella sp.]
MNTTYHYVVFCDKNEMFRAMFKEAVEQQDVEYIDAPIRYARKNIIMQWMYNIHFNEYVNYFYDLSGKEWWYKYYYTKPDTGNLCFLFLICWSEEKYISLFKLIKEKYPKAKLVLYLEDIRASRGWYDRSILQYFDKVISYDKGDSQKYGFSYFP